MIDFFGPINELKEKIQEMEDEFYGDIREIESKLDQMTTILLEKEKDAMLQEEDYKVEDENDKFEKMFAEAYNKSKFKYKVKRIGYDSESQYHEFF